MNARVYFFLAILIAAVAIVVIRGGIIPVDGPNAGRLVRP